MFIAMHLVKPLFHAADNFVKSIRLDFEIENM